ncbi:M15 family metallopeptidase, partial [bacterium]|nr:M15 family metallopeptidase [bacterium]
MVLHKPYPVANESELRTADQDRRGRPTQSTPDAAAAFGRMKSAAASSGVGLIAFSGYRSPDRQRELFHNAQRRHGRLHAARWVAPPGYSEHQTGLAFDIGDVGRPEADDETVFETTAAFEWLSRRAAEFQFEMSFPPDNAQRVA